MGFFKKSNFSNNNNLKVNLIKSILSKTEEKLNNFYFDKKLFNFYKKLIKKEKQTNFMNFNEFSEKLLIILMNNQGKIGFNIQKGLLLLDTKKYPIYKKIAFIKNEKFLKQFLKGIYKKYYYLF